MCFVITKEKFQLHVVEKPVTVYKIVSPNWLGDRWCKSLYQGYPYEYNKEYAIEDKLGIIANKNTIAINYGFHSYLDESFARDFLKSLQNADRLFYNKSTCDDAFVVKCVIPKGSTFVCNYEQAVSDKIIILKP